MTSIDTLRRLFWGAAVATLCVSPMADIVEKSGAAPGATYLSGGVGEEEMKEIRGMRSDYNTRFEFSEQVAGQGRNQWTSGVDFQIKSGDQIVVQDKTDGPVLMLNLDPGTYEIEANYGGETKTKRFEVREGRTSDHHMSWRNMSSDK
ncbi:hypothetical protein [Chitinimonas lacunae]|uniref:Carboxypeptidase regulatory-like domain-containing protein n=1 Tax=Chitinimonas lacunae TaxID=1963018 RepID=A0ABV8MTH9_9NEIS